MLRRRGKAPIGAPRLNALEAGKKEKKQSRKKKKPRPSVNASGRDPNREEKKKKNSLLCALVQGLPWRSLSSLQLCSLGRDWRGRVAIEGSFRRREATNKRERERKKKDAMVFLESNRESALLPRSTDTKAAKTSKEKKNHSRSPSLLSSTKNSFSLLPQPASSRRASSVVAKASDNEVDVDAIVKDIQQKVCFSVLLLFSFFSFIF